MLGLQRQGLFIMAILLTMKQWWHSLPDSVRLSPPAQWLKAKALERLPTVNHTMASTDNELKSDLAPIASVIAPPKPAKQQVINSLEELDTMLQRLDAMAAISDDELRRGFTLFKMQMPLTLPADPDSPEYRAVQMQLYAWLHGKPYQNTNEVTHFDVATNTRQPFPFSTQSTQTVGNQLIAIGFLIKTLNLKANAKVLEFGPGWGNTTVWLARMGYAVTAIDIEPRFVELIQARAKAKQLTIDVRQGDFTAIKQLNQRYDAVVFFECFHHCADHQTLIASLDKVVAPHGKVVFAAEPITDAFADPWGLRLDGESLWAIRKHGWLELGFRETYFRQLLAKHGWRVTKTICPETPWGEIFVATRSGEA